MEDVSDSEHERRSNKRQRMVAVDLPMPAVSAALTRVLMGGVEAGLFWLSGLLWYRHPKGPPPTEVLYGKH